MSHNRKPYQINSEVSDNSSEALEARRNLYAVLARGFSYPDESVVEFFSQADSFQVQDNRRLARSLKTLFEQAQTVDSKELRRVYLVLFDPINGPFPYEAEHRQVHDFSKAQVMADVMGFYRAFGVEPRNDRPDHIAAELEFMHLLTLKQSHALNTGQPEKAALCQDAQEKFLRDHLLVWAEPLLKAMRVRKDLNGMIFYPHLMDILKLFMQSERERLT